MLRARIMARLAGRRHIVGEAYWLGRPALEMARRLGDKPTLAYVLNAMAWGTWGPEDVAENLRLAEEMIQVAEEVSDGKLVAEGHLWRACCELQLGDIEAADRDIDFQLRFAESSRQPYQRWLAALNRAARAFVEARLDESEQHLREATVAATDLWGTGIDPVVVTLDRGVGPAIRRQRDTLTGQQIAAYETMASRSSAPIWRIALASGYLAAGRIEQAKREFERFAVEDFTNVPRDIMWTYAMLRLSEAASLIGDVERARLLYELLLPHADRCIVSGTILCHGSAHYPLGLLASVLGRFDDAERHFDAALAMNRRIRGRLWIAHVEHEYGRMLWKRGRDGDRTRALAFLESALATARECGLHVLEKKLQATIADSGFAVRTPSAAPAPAPAEAVFRRDGDFWTLVYEGGALRLKDSKGLQYIAVLLRQEGKEIHAADLASGQGVSTEGARDRGDAGEILDAQARSEYRQRVEDLEAELEEATRWSDVGRAARLREEIDFLKDELSAAFGVGGRSRKAGDVTERARKAVASRIRDTIERIRKEHRPLALHLENAIRTGAYCSYEPDRSPGWKL